MIKVALLPGDGVGVEVMEGPAQMAHHLADHEVLEVTGPWPVGATAFAKFGQGLPSATLDAVREADAVLLGAVGEHPGITIGTFRPELALLELRERFDLRVSIRQVWRPDRQPITFVRNLLGGAYGAADTRQESYGTRPNAMAWDRFEMVRWRVEEICSIAHGYLRQSPNASFISVDKANLLATSRLWRQTVSEYAEKHELQVRHVLVDRFAYEIGALELSESVIVTEGLFGDILSDLASGRAGSIAMCGSASVNPGTPNFGRCVGVFEPVHGSAPRRAGQNTVNPIGGFLALAALVEWFPDTHHWGSRIRAALATAVDMGSVTYDIAKNGQSIVTTSVFSEIVNRCFVDLIP